MGRDGKNHKQCTSQHLQKTDIMAPNITKFYMRNVTVSSIIVPLSLKTLTQEILGILFKSKGCKQELA